MKNTTLTSDNKLIWITPLITTRDKWGEEVD